MTTITTQTKYLSFKILNVTVSLPESYIKNNTPWLFKLFKTEGFKQTTEIGDISCYIPENRWTIAQCIVDLEKIIIPIKKPTHGVLSYPQWERLILSKQVLYFLKHGPEASDYPEGVKNKWKCTKCYKEAIKRYEVQKGHKFKVFMSNIVCENCGRNWQGNQPSNLNLVPCGCDHEWEEI